MKAAILVEVVRSRRQTMRYSVRISASAISSARRFGCATNSKSATKVLESQRAFANVVVPYTRETSKLSTLISGAAPDESARRRVLVDNPAVLYGFGWRMIPQSMSSGPLGSLQRFSERILRKGHKGERP